MVPAMLLLGIGKPFAHQAHAKQAWETHEIKEIVKFDDIGFNYIYLTIQYLYT